MELTVAVRHSALSAPTSFTNRATVAVKTKTTADCQKSGETFEVIGPKRQAPLGYAMGLIYGD